MPQPRLRIYCGPPDPQVTTTTMHDTDSTAEKVTVPLGEILPQLGEAMRSERTWLRDFEDDEITISADLYEVILAYQHFRRPSA